MNTKKIQLFNNVILNSVKKLCNFQQYNLQSIIHYKREIM